MKIIFFLGNPNAKESKTINKAIEKRNWKILSTKDQLQAEMEERSSLGVQATYHLDAKGSVPKNLIAEIAADAAWKMRFEGVEGVILNDAPATLHQALLLENCGLSPSKIIVKLGKNKYAEILNFYANMGVPIEDFSVAEAEKIFL